MRTELEIRLHLFALDQERRNCEDGMELIVLTTTIEVLRWVLGAEIIASPGTAA